MDSSSERNHMGLQELRRLRPAAETSDSVSYSQRRLWCLTSPLAQVPRHMTARSNAEVTSSKCES
jgi:hypothetical protein